MTILVITTLLPSRTPNGGELCTLRFVEGLSALGLRYHLAGDRRPGEEFDTGRGWIALRERIPEYRSAGVKVLLDAAVAIVRGEPHSVRRIAARGWVNRIRSVIAETKPAAIIADHLQVALLLQRLGISTPTGMVAHNIEGAVYRTLAEGEGSPIRRWALSREYKLLDPLERRISQNMKTIWTVTAEDRNTFVDFGCRPERVHLLPLYLRSDLIDSDLHQQRIVSSTPEYDIGMIGSWTWQANGDGLRWFIDAVVPLLPASTRILVAGRGAEWLHGKDPRVKYLGFVESVVDFYAKVRTIAVPVFSGGGIQEKLIEVLGLGLPVVSSDFGARGILDRPANLVVTNEPAKFAAELIRLAGGAASRSELLQVGVAWSRARRQRYLDAVRSGIAQLGIL